MGYANEERRNDPILRAAIIKIIERELVTLKESLPVLEKLYRGNSVLDGTSIWSLIDRSKWYIRFYTGVLEGEVNGTSAYAGNKAAFLTDYDAERIKSGVHYDKLP
jgi:hypothetical protein